MRPLILLILLRVTLIPLDAHYPNRVYLCAESRVFPNGWVYCLRPDDEVLWVEVERPSVVVTEPIEVAPQ